MKIDEIEKEAKKKKKKKKKKSCSFLKKDCCERFLKIVVIENPVYIKKKITLRKISTRLKTRECQKND